MRAGNIDIGVFDLIQNQHQVAQTDRSRARALGDLKTIVIGGRPTASLDTKPDLIIKRTLSVVKSNVGEDLEVGKGDPDHWWTSDMYAFSDFCRILDVEE